MASMASTVIAYIVETMSFSRRHQASSLADNLKASWTFQLSLPTSLCTGSTFAVLPDTLSRIATLYAQRPMMVDERV
jgi:hypothetical protein